MLTLETKKIEKKLHPFDENALIKAPSRRYLILQPLKTTKNKIITKNAPKYSKALLIGHWADHKLVNALKRIKRSDYGNEGRFESYKDHQWRLILQNKYKTIQSFEIDILTKQEIQKHKAFLNVKEIRLNLTYERVLKGKEQKERKLFLMNLLHYLPGMKKIKSLDLDIYSQTDLDLLEKLNSMSGFLSSLQILRIRRETIEEMNILPVLTKCPSILAHTTHFSLMLRKQDKANEIFECLLKSCRKLISLEIDFDREFLRFSVDQSGYPVFMNNFDKLDVVKISIIDFFCFLEEFVPPPSLKHITLDLTRSPWNKVNQTFFGVDLNSLSDEKIKCLLENDKRLARFFEKWSGFKNLVSLNLITNQDLQQNSSILILLRSLFKNLPALETLQLQLWPGRAEEKYDTSVVETQFDLGDIFEALQDVCRTLKSLKLSFFQFDNVDCLEIPESFTFPPMTEIDISESGISNPGIIGNLFDAMEMQEPGRSLKILISHVLFRNSELVDLLEILQEAPENCKIELKILEYVKSENFYEDLNSFIEESSDILPVKNVSVLVVLKNVKHLQEFCLLDEIFENVQFQKPESS